MDFRLSWREAAALNRGRDRFAQFEGSRQYFTKADGSDFTEGELFIQADLARTLQRIADRRSGTGFLPAKRPTSWCGKCRRMGGIFTHEDLANYRSVWREPLQVQ